MVWDVKVTAGQPDAIPAHLVNKILSDDNDLLTAVLDPGQNRGEDSFYFSFNMTQVFHIFILCRLC